MKQQAEHPQLTFLHRLIKQRDKIISTKYRNSALAKEDLSYINEQITEIWELCN